MKNIMMILLVVLSVSCTSKKIDKNTATNNTEMKDKHIGLYDIWGLKELNGNSLTIKKGIVLELNTKELTFYGNAACNNISGSLNLEEGNHISFENTRATRMACPDLNVEQNYLKALELVKFYKIENLHLLLLDENDNVLLDYIKMD